MSTPLSVRVECNSDVNALFKRPRTLDMSSAMSERTRALYTTECQRHLLIMVMRQDDTTTAGYLPKMSYPIRENVQALRMMPCTSIVQLYHHSTRRHTCVVCTVCAMCVQRPFWSTSKRNVGARKVPQHHRHSFSHLNSGYRL